MRTLLTLTLVAAVAYGACYRPGYYGDDCNTACGSCKDDAVCDKKNGNCPAGGCADGWSGDKCDIAECFGQAGDAGCAENGKCVAPNYCVCGESGAQVVGLKRTYDGIEGINCVSLRRDGIKGAGIALIVMFVSISTCGLIAEKNRK